MIRRRSVTPLPWDATWQDRTMAFWWRRVPAFFRLFSTNLGIAMRDGRYATAWRPVASLAPVAAFVAGVVAALARPAGADLYSFSVATTGVLLAVSGLGSAFGGFAWVGFLLADLARPSPFGWGRARFGWLAADLGLALVMVLVPVAAQQMRRGLGENLRRFGGTGKLVELVAHVALHLVLVWSWLLAVPSLVRPAWIWAHGTPPDAASHVLDRAVPLITVAAASVVLRLLIRQVVVSSPARVARVVAYTGAGAEAAVELEWTFDRPVVLTLLAQTGLATLFMAGVFSRTYEAAVVAVAIFLVLEIRRHIGKTGGFVRAVTTVPLAIRLLLGALITLVIANRFLASTYTSQSTLTPLLVVALPGVVLISFFVPEEAIQTPGKGGAPQLAVAETDSEV